MPLLALVNLTLALSQDLTIDVLGEELLHYPNVVEMIESNGYPVESHEVITEDGYILTMHRIPYGKADGAGPVQPGEPNKPVVYLQHGLLSSSADWVVIGPEDALSYLLADKGYDVWMGNARGNTWSRRHVEYDPDGLLTRKLFWDFSWHEIAIYDLPAMIDYIREETGQAKLHYVGHSQGTTTILILLSEKPEYNDFLLSTQLLAPVAYMSHLKSPFVRILSPFVDELYLLAYLIGLDEFAPSNLMMQMGGQLACMDASPTQEVCANVMFLIGGYDSGQLNRTQLPAIFANAPAGAATKQLVHYAQEYNSAHFRQYDHGAVENMEKYGSVSPPDYPVEVITAKLNLYYSYNDWLSSEIDVARLEDRLSNYESFLVPLPAFNHFDYCFAIDVKELVYDYVINVINLADV